MDEIPNEDIETVEDTDLLVKFSKMKLKNQPKSTGICEKEYETSINGHISQMPVEVLIYILKWMVSSELDLKSLENFSEACRGFFVISRVSDLWRRICIQTWGVAGKNTECENIINPKIQGSSDQICGEPHCTVVGGGDKTPMVIRTN